MDASTFLSYLVSHYGVGLVEYAQVRGVDQVLRVGEGVRARVVLQGRELLPDAVGVLLCSRMEHETFPEGRVYTAVERGGFEGTWLLPGADATHTWLHEVADDLAARDAQRGAQAPGPVDPRELVRRLKAGLEASSAR